MQDLNKYLPFLSFSLSLSREACVREVCGFFPPPVLVCCQESSSHPSPASESKICCLIHASYVSFTLWQRNLAWWHITGQVGWMMPLYSMHVEKGDKKDSEGVGSHSLEEHRCWNHLASFNSPAFPFLLMYSSCTIYRVCMSYCYEMIVKIQLRALHIYVIFNHV